MSYEFEVGDMLRRFSIQVRLAMIVSALIVGLILLSTISLIYEYRSLYSQQEEKVQKIVEVGHSTIAHYYQQFSDGLIDEATAKAEAIALIKDIRYDGENYLWINDQTPTMIMHPIKSSLNGQPLANIKDPDGTALFVDMVNVVNKSGQGFVPYKWPKPGFDEPVAKVSYVKSFKPWGWIVGTGVYIDNIDDLFLNSLVMLISMAIIISILVAGFVYIVSRSILLPAIETSTLMENIAQGEGDLTKRLDVKGKDEITQLASFFNTFVSKMQDSLAEVANTSRKVAKRADSLSETSQSNNDLIQAQNDNMTQVAAAMEEMSTNIQEVSSNAESAEHAALEAQKNTSSTKDILTNAIERVEGLSSDIDQVSEVILKLEQESVNIGSVLDVIRGIAEQTNLLALNAAIEAARAGEQGRGFAVVADEVRTLASRTAQSTDEIQAMIEKLQQGAKEAVNAVKHSQSTSGDTVEMTATAQQALTEIDQLTSVISEMNSQIAKATEQQSHASNEINLRVNELAGLTTESVSHTEHLANASEDLRQHSKAMQGVVARFKI